MGMIPRILTMIPGFGKTVKCYHLPRFIHGWQSGMIIKNHLWTIDNSIDKSIEKWIDLIILIIIYRLVIISH